MTDNFTDDQLKARFSDLNRRLAELQGKFFDITKRVKELIRAMLKRQDDRRLEKIREKMGLPRG